MKFKTQEPHAMEGLSLMSEETQVYQRLPMLRHRKCQTTTPQTRINHIAGVVRNILIYSLALWGLINVIKMANVTYYHKDHPSGGEGCSCGDSVAEAVSRGCKFDSLAMAWLPEHCRDDDLTAEFNRMGDGDDGSWVYYADTAHTTRVPVGEVAAMGDNPDGRVHMNKDWHQIHCLFYWLKLQRAQHTGKRVEPASDHEGHVRHCGQVFREPGYGTISGVKLNTDEVEHHSH